MHTSCPQTTLERVYNRNNASDMEAQWYYRWLRDTYPWHVVAQFVALFALGGFPAVVSGHSSSPTPQRSETAYSAHSEAQ